MSLRGISIHAEETPQAIVKSSDGLLSLKTNKGTVDGFTHVMFATGRRPNTKVKISHVRLHMFLVDALCAAMGCKYFFYACCL